VRDVAKRFALVDDLSENRDTSRVARSPEERDDLGP
jgi:hypothetical protein